MNNYPEHDRLAAISDESQTIGEFLEWAESQGWQLMEWRTDLTDSVTCDCRFERRYSPDPNPSCRNCKGTGHYEITGLERWVAAPGTVIQKLAQFFEIDLTKIEAEKRAMLASLAGL